MRLLERLRGRTADGDKREALLKECTASLVTAELDGAVQDLLRQMSPGATTRSGADEVLGPDVLRDVEMFEGYTSSASNSVFEKLCCCKLRGGRALLRALLQTPVAQVERLRARVATLQLIENDPATLAALQKEVQVLARHEEGALWLFAAKRGKSQEVQQEMQTLLDVVYFNTWLLRGLNKSDAALYSTNINRILLSPVLGLLSPLVYFVIPYYIVRFQIGMPIGFAAYIKFFVTSMWNLAGSNVPLKLFYMCCSCFIYFHGIMGSLEISRCSYMVSRLITTRMAAVQAYASAVQQLEAKLPSARLLSAFFGELLPSGCCKDINPNIKKVPERFTLLSNFGSALALFKALTKAPDAATAISHLLVRSWMYDTVLSILQLKRELGLCYPTFVPPRAPHLTLRSVWHPFLDPSTVVRNDVVLGTLRNMLLTGPNAGGKSTLLKAVILTVLMAQTVCVVSAGQALLSPFTYINSHIHVPDVKGHASLFQAEMFQVKEQFERLQRMGPGRPALLVYDEMFSSTNPVEGVAGSYAVAERMAAFPHLITLISTHFTYLAKLQRATRGRFLNFKMECAVNKDGSVRTPPPYRLVRGISRQYIALELMKQHGFDADIINSAIQLKNQIIGRRLVPAT